jgi:hypothetical protein
MRRLGLGLGCCLLLAAAAAAAFDGTMIEF